MAFKVADGYVEVHARADRASARRAANDAVQESDRVGRNNEGSLLRWLFKTNPSIAQMIERPLSSIFGSPIMFAGAVVFATAISGFLSTAITTAILGAVGAGLIAAGIFALRKNQELKDEWASTTKAIEDSMARAAKPFLGPLLSGIDYLEKRMVKLEPTFARLFQAAGPLITPAIDMLVGFLEAMLPGIEKAMPGIQVVFDTLAKHMPGLGTAVGDFFATIAENGPLLERTIGLMIQWLEITFKVLGPILVALMGSFVMSAAAWNMMTDTIVKSAKWIGDTWDKIPGWWDRTWGAVAGWFTGLWASITGFFSGVGTETAKFWDSLTATVSERFAQLGAWFTGLPGVIWGFIQSIPGLIVKALMGGFDLFFYSIGFAIGSIIRIFTEFPILAAAALFTGWTLITEGTSRAWDFITGLISGARNRMIEILVSLGVWVVNFWVSNWARWIKAAEDGVRGIIKWVGDLPANMREIGIRALLWLSSAIQDGFSRSTREATLFPGRIVLALVGLGRLLYNIGQDAIRGLINGIENMMGWAVDMAWRAARKIAEGFMDALGIGSPSKWMADNVGRWLPPGIMVGVDKSMPGLIDKINGLPDLLTGQRSLAPNPAPMTAAGATTNQYSITISVSQLTELEDIKKFLDGKLTGTTTANNWAGNIYEAQGAYARGYQ